MNTRPLILLAPGREHRGVEFHDLSLSVSSCYARSIHAAGGLPLVLPMSLGSAAIAECVRRADGIVLTGGDDVDPLLYAKEVPAHLKHLASVPDRLRDWFELTLVETVFAQRKPLLAICRGQQILNVALGGTLVADVATQMPGTINHRRMDRRSEIVHDVRLTPGSVLARITGRQKLGVNSTHHQAVGRVAPPLRVAAASPDGVVEALEWRPGAGRRLPFLVSVQFHPERLADRYPEHQAIFQAFTRACRRNGQ